MNQEFERAKWTSLFGKTRVIPSAAKDRVGGSSRSRGIPGITVNAGFARFLDCVPLASLPDRREIWVPADQLDLVLKKNPKAVLLSREEYEMLLRDAKRGTNPAPEPPRPAAFTAARYDAQIDGKVVQVLAQLTVNVL